MPMELTSPDVGGRVWTRSGLHQHGPVEGPKVDVPPNLGGEITGMRDVFSRRLYEVRWDSGQVSRHYLTELICIGPFATLGELEAALAGGHSAKLWLDPSGGLRSFEMKVGRGAGSAIVHLVKEQRSEWRDIIEPLIHRAGIDVEVSKAPSTVTETTSRKSR